MAALSVKKAARAKVVAVVAEQGGSENVHAFTFAQFIQAAITLAMERKPPKRGAKMDVEHMDAAIREFVTGYVLKRARQEDVLPFRRLVISSVSFALELERLSTTLDLLFDIYAQPRAETPQFEIEKAAARPLSRSQTAPALSASPGAAHKGAEDGAGGGMAAKAAVPGFDRLVQKTAPTVPSKDMPKPPEGKSQSPSGKRAAGRRKAKAPPPEGMALHRFEDMVRDAELFGVALSHVQARRAFASSMRIAKGRKPLLHKGDEFYEAVLRLCLAFHNSKEPLALTDGQQRGAGTQTMPQVTHQRLPNPVSASV